MNDLSLLPGDPVRFFGLTEGYDRRDLKRAYGKAIRIYKPESNPAEFGLVRDAYEQLERLLRYGKQRQQLSDAVDTWQRAPQAPSPEPSAPAGTPKPSTPKPQRKPTAESVPLRTLATIDPDAALRRIETMSRRTPPDYYLAAILTDATTGKPTAKYLAHLLEGLQAYPSDPGLMNLATEFLRTEVPDAMMPKIVCYVAEKIRAPSFYMLTEPLWLRLVDQLPFHQWGSLLADCERKIRQTEPAIRTVFYLRILRSAIWVAPSEWVERTIREIESQSAELQYTVEAELEFLSHIQQLLRSEVMSVSTNPVRRQLLDAIRLSCQRDDPALTAEVLKIVTRVAHDATGVRRAFPMATADNDTAWVLLIYSLVEQYQLLLDDVEEVTPARLIAQVRHLVKDLKPQLERINAAINRADWNYRIWPLVFWMIFGTMVGALPVTVIPFLIFGGTGSAGALLALAGIVALLAGTYISYFRWFYPRFLHERLLKKRSLWSNQAYEKRWRSRLFRFVSSGNEPVQSMLVRIDAVGRAGDAMALGNTVAYFVRRDAGLCILAALRMMLR